MGGEHFLDDSDFVETAKDDVDRLATLAGLNQHSNLVDWGCGAGRLAVGVVERYGRIDDYVGVDVQKDLIAWANRHVGGREGFRFVHANLANERYNPHGEPVQWIPADSRSADVFYAYSVFSHLKEADIAGYLGEVARILKPGGRAFLTAFVEDNVPDEEENPVGYGPIHWSGRLHCVRFGRGHFDALVRSAGLQIACFEHGQETDGQSLYVLRSPA